MKTATATLTRDSTSPGRARRLVRDLIDGQVPQDLAEVVELLVSEIVTNAVVHARGAPHIDCLLFDDGVRVEVRDADFARSPTLRPAADPTATSGRGLALVDTLATDWGIETEPRVGKTVWFEIDT